MSELVCKTLELLAESKGGFLSAVKNIFNTKTMVTLKISALSVGDLGKGDELSEWRKKREMHSKMMGAAINAGVMGGVKFHSTYIMQCDRMIAFLERGIDKEINL